jgi:hypothetical protein
MWYHHGVFVGKFEKLYRKAANSPDNLSFSDLCALAEAVGFVLRKRGGGTSHLIYRHPKVRELMNLQNDHGKAKPYQVKQLLTLIEEYELLEE